MSGSRWTQFNDKNHLYSVALLYIINLQCLMYNEILLTLQFYILSYPVCPTFLKAAVTFTRIILM